MRRFWLALLAAGCSSPFAQRRPVSPDALRGVTLGVPTPADARPTPGIGCGQLAQDLPLRAHKALVAAFSDAGAATTNSDRERWTLHVALREATMGEENTRARRTDRPVQSGGPDAPSIDQPQASIFNGGNDRAVVVLDATLERQGALVWRDTISGRARSAPCIEAVQTVREALLAAVDELRDDVVQVVRRMP